MFPLLKTGLGSVLGAAVGFAMALAMLVAVALMASTDLSSFAMLTSFLNRFQFTCFGNIAMPVS